MKEEAKNFIIKAIDSLSSKDVNNGLFFVNEAIRVLRGAIDYIKNNTFNIPDSSFEYNGIKIGLDNNINMEVGDEIGMIAHLIPHNYKRSNPFHLTTMNKNIIDVDGMILTAKGVGTTTLKVTSLDGKYTDSIDITVSEKYEYIVSDDKTYTLIPENFNLIENDYSYDVSVRNNNAIRAILTYAKNNGYNKIIFPKDKIYYIDGHDTIYLKNDLIIDFNGSSLVIAPNPYIYGYNAILVNEYNKEYNIAPKGYINSSGVEFTKSIKNNFKTSTWVNENNATVTEYKKFYNVYTYNLNYTSGGEDGIVYLKDKINVVNSFNEYYTDDLVKGEKYMFKLNLFKHKPYESTNTYTTNTISAIAELYKNNTLLKEQTIASCIWRENNTYVTSLTNTFSITDDVDYIKIKITGMSDTYPIEAVLEDMYISLDNSNYNKKTENIVLQNGSILGERNVFEEDGTTEVKNTIFNEVWGKDWTDGSFNGNELEGSISLGISKGKNIFLKNMNIGNSIGFNIGMDNVSDENTVKKYYPNANDLEYGYIDENGNLIDSNDYARTASYIEVDTSESPYFMVTDPAFTIIYYYGYRSRLINVYCYDENKKLLESKMFKLRHGMLKAPEGTKYLKLCVPIMTSFGEELITTGNSDFSNCIFAIKFMRESKNVRLEKCTISNNYSTGIAMGGNNISIEDCIFSKNDGRMPHCDIDCEDGWVRMQNITFKNNKFQSYYGVIMCAGQNFVFKNNEISSFTSYDQCQLFKWYGNKFLNTGYGSSFKCQQDSYMINNEFAEGTNYITGKCIGDAEYEIYSLDNTFLNNTTISSNTYMYNNNYSGDIKISSFKEEQFVNGYNINNSPNVTSIAYNIDNVYNGMFNSLPVSILTNCTFNNCTFTKMPDYRYNCIATFDNCTLYNPKKSTSYIINDNCNVINGVIDNLIYDNLVTDSLIATIQEVQGEYDVINNSINIDNDFTIVYKSKHLSSDSNYGVKLFEASDMKFSSYWNKGGLEFDINSYDTDNVSTRFYKVEPANLVDEPYILYTIVYNKDNRSIKGYVGSNLLLSYTIPDGNNLKPLASVKIDSSVSSKAMVETMYIYNKALSEEEITQNYNALI